MRYNNEVFVKYRIDKDSIVFWASDINENISDVVTIDQNAADAINKSKNDFFEKYEYLKPDIEKKLARRKMG